MQVMICTTGWMIYLIYFVCTPNAYASIAEAACKVQSPTFTFWSLWWLIGWELFKLHVTDDFFSGKALTLPPKNIFDVWVNFFHVNFKLLFSMTLVNWWSIYMYIEMRLRLPTPGFVVEQQFRFRILSELIWNYDNKWPNSLILFW